MTKGPEFREYVKYLSLGTEIAIGLSAPIFIGVWIDYRWNTSPWFLLLGIFTGIAILTGTAIRIIRNPEND